MCMHSFCFTVDTHSYTHTHRGVVRCVDYGFALAAD